ncbi:MAG TPA: hypothetical protein PLL78_03260 [Fimbriimonadaceae bacterium]|nr:hypothetical protein [Fimbriimonadaceae bacterium]HRJ95678.1 hypothetical protein [Fimbriimonadaceae bacterium]
MNAILYVVTDSFYVRALGGVDTDRVAIHRDKVVLDATKAAQRAGVRIGMSLAEARATSSAVRFVTYRREDYSAAREAWLDVCVEFANRIEPAEDHAAFLDLSEHPDPQEVASILIHRLGSSSRAAIAKNKWLARLAVETHGTPCGRIPFIEDSRGFLASLPIAHLRPVDSKTRERLEFLGYRTIGAVAEAPPTALKGHFGLEANRICEAARGGVSEPVQATYPPDSLSVRRHFTGGCADREVLFRGIAMLARQAAAELVARDRVGQSLRLIVVLEEGDPIVVARRWSKPLQSAQGIIAALNSMWAEFEQSAVEPAYSENHVQCVRLWLTQLERAPVRQRSLGVYGLKEIDDSVHAVSQIGQALPPGAIVRASEVPESRRRRVLRVWRDATGWH